MAGITEKTEAVEQTQVEDKKKKVRGETCTIQGKKYFVRAPKAKDMIALDLQFQEHKSVFAQGLLLVAHQCDDITFEELSEMYVDDLDEVFSVFEKLMNTKANTTAKAENNNDAASS